jgi:prepilin-type N-terminal cleavage/methylation domain-containing protein
MSIKNKKSWGGDRAFTLLNNRKANLIGFTLIELLIVVAIIGIIAGIIVVTVQNAIHRATIARSLSFSRAIEQTLGLDLRGSWPFNGRALDRSGWNNHGTLHNFTPTTGDWVPGVIGEALRFDGVDDVVSVPHTAQLSSEVFGTNTIFTLESWAFPRAWVNWAGIINKAISGYVSGATNGTWADTAGFRCIMGSNVAGNPAGSLIGVSNQPSLNQWHHVVCVADGTILIMFVNGVRVGQTSIAGLTHPRSENTAPLVLGRRCFYCTPSFNGDIDEARAFSRAMPVSYIQKRYVEGVKSLAINGGITQEEKQERLTALRNSGQLVIDLDAALAGEIDFSIYNKYLVLEATE